MESLYCAKTLLPPDSFDVDAAYQDICNIVKKVAKNTIPRGYRNNYIPCWDAECEFFYRNFLQFSQRDDLSLAAAVLLAKLAESRGIDSPKQSEASTFHTLVKRHGVF